MELLDYLLDDYTDIEATVDHAPMSVAVYISLLFDDDPAKTELPDGTSFDLVCWSQSGKLEPHPGKKGICRYVFPDGSAMVMRGEQWAIEGVEPFSMAASFLDEVS